jgi:hypothetical protein
MDLLAEFIKREKEFLSSLPKIKRIKRRRRMRRTTTRVETDARQPGDACPICLGEMKRMENTHYRTRLSSCGRLAETVRCLHRFHYHCLEQWLLVSSNCPLCRCPVPLDGGIDI